MEEEDLSADFSPSSGGWGSESEASAGEARQKKAKTENASSTVNAATTKPQERIRRFACCLKMEAPLNLPDWELRRQLDKDWQIVLRKVPRPLQRTGRKQEPAKNGQKMQPAATGQQQGGAVPFKAMPWSVKRLLAKANSALKPTAKPQQVTAPTSALPPRVLRPPPPLPPPVPMEVLPPWRGRAILLPGPKASPSVSAAPNGKRKKKRKEKTRRVPDTNGVVAVSLSSDDEPISSSSSRSCSRRPRSGSSSSSRSRSRGTEGGTTSKEQVTCTPALPAEVPEVPVSPQLEASSKALLVHVDLEDSDSSEGGEPAG